MKCDVKESALGHDKLLICHEGIFMAINVLLFLQFIIEDMKQHQTNKHSNLHREDQHITVEELWRGWKISEGIKSKSN